MTSRRSTGKEARAMQAGCNAVMDQFARLRAGIVAELAKCPDGERRAGLLRTLERTDQEIAIMQRMASRYSGETEGETRAGLDRDFIERRN
jgi:hypothetical protein